MILHDVTFFLRYYVQSMRRRRRSCVLVLAKVMCHCQLSQRKELCGRKLIKVHSDIVTTEFFSTHQYFIINHVRSRTGYERYEVRKIHDANVAKDLASARRRS